MKLIVPRGVAQECRGHGHCPSLVTLVLPHQVKLHIIDSGFCHPVRKFSLLQKFHLGKDQILQLFQ